jgi:cation transport regulator ChaB
MVAPALLFRSGFASAAISVEVMMPFQSLEDLPPSPRSRRLPGRAQEIFRTTFNNARATYAASTPHEREELCHCIAWSGVKNFRVGR